MSNDGWNRDIGASVVMYGMGPSWPERVEPIVPNFTLVDTQQPYTAPSVAPEDANAIRVRLEKRVAWLENELRMHKAWKEELLLLKRMLETTSK